MKRVWLSWSSGKDSAWAFQRIRMQADFEVIGLFTTLNREFDRVTMHAVRRELLETQAKAVGLPLRLVSLPWPCSNQQYETIMAHLWSEMREAGVEAVVFGDLFLEDVRRYRQDQLNGTGLEALFPLWGLPTGLLAEEMISEGLRAKITCVDPSRLDRRFAGRDFDPILLADLPPQIDPCGENGEFHTFAYAGPMFSGPLRLSMGQTTERDGFVFADILPRHFRAGTQPGLEKTPTTREGAIRSTVRREDA